MLIPRIIDDPYANRDGLLESRVPWKSLIWLTMYVGLLMTGPVGHIVWVSVFWMAYINCKKDKDVSLASVSLTRR